MNILDEFIIMLIWSIAVSTFAVTVTLSKIFAPFRQTIKTKSPFLGDLVSCPYCFSHWCSFLVVLIIRPTLLQVNPVLSFVVVSLAMVGMSAWSARWIINTYGNHKEEK